MDAFLHNHGIAVEDVVTCKTIDGLLRSSVGQRATGVAEQSIGIERSIDDDGFRGDGFRHSVLSGADSRHAEGLTGWNNLVLLFAATVLLSAARAP